MFIGREAELAFLQSKYEEKGGQLIVLYGRRRVGKTETLREFCKGKPHVFYSCTQSTDKVQLAKFSKQVFKEDIPAKKYISEFADWESALRSVLDLPYGDRKKMLIIDEFPYMCKGNKSIPSILQNLWDAELKDQNVMIVLCGSAMSFIEKELLAEKNPLYGRATGIYKMTEMGFYDAIKFFPNYSDEEKVLSYAILGGIPHYLRQFNPELSVAENIKRNILTKGCVLYSEVDFLLRQELRETGIYNVIIEAIALGNTKLNDIFQKTQIEKTKLSAYLKNLMELGIIYREFSMDDQVKEQANVQRGLYKVADNFFRFWYAFVFPNISELESGDAGGIFRHIVRPELDNYTSYIFEDVCKAFLRRKNRKEELPFYFSKIGRWWNKSDEMDIMAVDRLKKNYILGECKYRNQAFAMSDLRNMQKKISWQKKDINVYYWIFSKSGYTEEVRKAAVEEGIQIVELREIVGLE